MDKNKYSSDMKEDIIVVLEQFKYDNYSIDQAAEEILDLFNVSESLPSDIEVGKAMSELSEIADKESER